jgi:hypothetical protein
MIPIDLTNNYQRYRHGVHSSRHGSPVSPVRQPTPCRLLINDVITEMVTFYPPRPCVGPPI